MGREIDALYYTIGYRTQGLSQAEAEVKASTKTIDDAIQKTGGTFSEVVPKARAAGAAAGSSFGQEYSRLSTEEVNKAAKQFDKLFGDAGLKSGSALAKNLSQGLRETFANEKVRIQQLLEDGMINPKQAKQLGATAAQQFNAGLQTVISEAQQFGKLEGKIGGEAFVSLAGQFKNIETASNGAGVGLSGLRRPLTSLADQALGVSRPLGQMTSTLGAFALGTGATIAIIAGITAISYAYEKITESALKSRKAIDAVIDGLIKQRDEQARSDAQRADNAVQTAQNEVERIKSQIRTLQTKTPTTGLNDGEGGGAAAAAMAVTQTHLLTKATEELRIANDALEQAKKNVTKATDDQTASYAKELSENIRNGIGTKRNLSDLILLAKNAKAELAAFNDESVKGQTLRGNYSIAHPGDPNAVLNHAQQLKDIVQAYQEVLDAQGKIDAKDKKQQETLEHRTQALKDRISTEIAALTPTSQDNIDAKIKTITDAAIAAKVPVTELKDALDQLRVAYSQNANTLAQKELSTLMADDAGAVDMVRNKFNQLITTFKEKGASPEIIKQFEELRDKAVAAAKAIQEAKDLVSNVKRGQSEQKSGTGYSINSAVYDQLDLAALTQSRDKLLEQQSKLTEGSKEWEAYQQEILQIDQEIQAIQDKIGKGITEAAKAAAAHVKHVDEMVGNLNAAINGALSLASAFGKVDEHTRLVLEGVKDIGNAMDQFAHGNIVGGVISSIEGVVSIGTGLLKHTKTPEEKAQEKALGDNTQATIENTRQLNLTSISATGTETQDFLKAISESNITGETKAHRQQQTDRLSDNLNKLGYTIQDFRDFAKQYGITLSPAIGGQEIQGLITNINNKQQATYADTYAGQKSSADDQAKIFGITDPVAQLKLFTDGVNKIAGGGGLLAKTLNQFDTSTAEGVEKAKTAIEGLFTQVQNGSITTADLAGLNRSDFLDALVQTQSYLGDISSSTYGGTGGYNVDRTITDTSASRLAAYAYTTTVWLEQIAGDIRAFLQSAGIVRPPTLNAPSTATGASGVQGLTIYANTNVNGAQLQTPEQAASLGQSISATILTQLSRQLQAAALLSGSNNGQPTMLS